MNKVIYIENEEPVTFCHVSPEVFQHLGEWFGILGQPIIRAIIINPDTKEKQIERFPPLFWVHQLGKRRNQHTCDTVIMEATTIIITMVITIHQYQYCFPKQALFID